MYVYMYGLFVAIFISKFHQFIHYFTFQVRLYMSRLPEEKIPYVNSIGEQFRARQLLLQLPPQDSDFKHCHNMSEEERNELKLFQAQRRRDALGRGAVRPIPETVEGVTGLCQQVMCPFYVAYLPVPPLF